MFFSAVLYLFSVLVRFELVAGTATAALTTGLLGYLFLAGGAYIGGEQVYSLGYMVDRHAWRGATQRWTALEPGEFAEGEPTKAKAGAQTLVVVRRGDAVHALQDVCAHAGCSLAENGRVVGSEIECACHGSRYRLRDGIVTRGPATYDQPAYEVRRAQGGFEARRAPAP
jgi:nitrite reductase/ring-hydroxylating ferredoxin subunit